MPSSLSATLTPSTKTLVFNGMMSVANVVDLTVTIPSSESVIFEDGFVYRITAKPAGFVSGPSIGYWVLTKTGDKTATTQIDLGISSIYSRLMNLDSTRIQFGITKVGEGSVAFITNEQSVSVWNDVYRPTDTSAVNPSENTLTDEEVMSLFDTYEVAAGLVSVLFTPTNYTAAEQTVESHLAGIDEAIGIGASPSSTD
jgi:hypothetical protein